MKLGTSTFCYFILFLFSAGSAFGQSATCAVSQPVCATTGVTFPAGVGTGTGEVGPDYGCLLTQPNPAWFHFEISTGGNLDLEISNSNNEDIDFILYGPFVDQSSPCTALLTAGNTEDCSYSTSATEVSNIVGSVAGEFYLMMVTNFSNNPTDISLTSLGSSTANTNCDLVAPVISDVALTMPSCSGLSDGMITITVQSASPPIEYSIDGGTNFQISNMFGGLAAATYNIVVKDGSGLQTTTTATLTDPSLLVITNVATVDPTCNGGSDGTITITASGGTGSLQYSIDNGVTFQASSSFTGLSAATYNIILEDANGCQATTTATLTDPAALMISNVATTDPTCNGDMDGSITITAMGGTGTLQYSVDNGTSFQASNIFNGQSAATYNIVVEDADGCQATTMATLSNPSAVTFTSSTTKENCGMVDGTITLAAAGGDGGPYTYSVDNGTTFQASGSFSGLSAGSYDVVIEDAGGCQGTSTVLVSGDDAPSITGITADVTLACFGDCNGQLTVSVTGGTSPYTYAWENGMGNVVGGNSSTVSGLCADTYNVTVTDAAGTSTDFWTEGFGLDAACSNQNQLATSAISTNGSWTQTILAAEGAVPNQWFISSTEAFTGTGNCGDGCLGNLALTNQTLHVGSLGVGLCPSGDCGAGYNPGANGETHKRVESPTIDCSAQTGVEVSFDYMHFGELGSDAARLSYFDGTSWSNLFTAMPQTACCGGACGSLLAQGQWAPTRYNFVLPTSANNNANVKIGFVWDNDGNNSGSDPSFAVDDIMLSGTNGGAACEVVSSFTLTQPTALTIGNVATADPTCNGDMDGSITITANGGTGALQYSIDNGTTFQASNAFAMQPAATYNVVVEDANGCQANTTATLMDPAALTISNVATTDPTCNGDMDGSITITATGGTATLQYSVDNGTTYQASNIFNGQSAGTYNIVVEDANGCQATTTATLSDPPALAISNVLTTDPTCNGDMDGSITITAMGGSSTLQYSVDNGTTFQASNAFTGQSAATYNIVVQDANGCQATTTVTLTDPAGVLISNVGAVDPTCSGSGTDGSITITASGGTGALQYSIDNGATFQASGSFMGLSYAVYDIVVEDMNGCQATSQTTLALDVSDCTIEITDPCSCLDNATPLQVGSGTGGDDGQFSEIITVSGGAGGLPNGLTFTVVGAMGALDANNIPAIGVQSAGVPIATDGSVTLLYNAGSYELLFVHVDDIGYSLTIEGPGAMGDPNNEVLMISNACAYPNPFLDPILLSTYCVANAPISLGGLDAAGIGADAISFSIDGMAATVFDPSALGLGDYTVAMIFDGAADANGGVSPDGGITSVYPGCTQVVEQVVSVIESGSLVGNVNCRDLNLSVDINGVTTFTLSELVPGAECLDLELVIESAYGGIVFQADRLNGTSVISFEVCGHLRETLKAYVSNPAHGTCWSSLTFKQSNGPILEGRSETVYCFDPLVQSGDIDDTVPMAFVPCEGSVPASFVGDWILDFECAAPGNAINDTAKIIYREYEAFDKRGQRGSIMDTIVVFRLPTIEDFNVYCPQIDTSYCGLGVAGPYMVFPELTPDGDPSNCDTLYFLVYDETTEMWIENPVFASNKCGIALHLDRTVFSASSCDEQIKYSLGIKQSCGGTANDMCEVGSNLNALEELSEGYYICEFWLTDLDTVAPTAICKGAPFFAGPLAQENWTFNTIRDFDFLNEDFLGGLVGDIPEFDDLILPDELTMLDTSKAPYSLKYGSEQIIADPDLFLGLNLGFMEAGSDMEFSFNWDFLLGEFDEETAIVPVPGAIGLVGYGINGTFYKLVEGVEEPLLDEFEPYQEYLDGIMQELEVDGELCNLNVSLLLEDSWGNTKISLKEGDVFTLFGIWVASSDASIQFSGENFVSTTTHDCAADAYVPPLLVHDDWSGIKQVKANVEGIGTVIMEYDPSDSCWVSHQQLEFGHREEPYLIEYEIYDSCHNVGTEICYLQVKDRTKPIAVADKGVTVSLSDKKVWVEASTFDEGSWDNCGVNFLLARRSDWATSCVDLCVNVVDTAIGTYEPAIFPVWTDGHDTLWCLDLEDDKTYGAVEAHYAKQLDWWCKDGEACSELIYNSWTYDLIKTATIQCASHSYLDEEGFENLLKKALQNPNADTSGVLNGLLEEKFKCSENLANAECILPFSFGRFPLLEFLFSGGFDDVDLVDNLPVPILAPGAAKVEMAYVPAERALCGYNETTLDQKLSSWRSIGGGWSDAVPFACEDACGPVTVEILVMDYWCNWSTSWAEVWVEDLTPVEVVKDVLDGTITCKAYKGNKYSYAGEEHPVSIEQIVASALQGEKTAYDALDGIFGGYEKAWTDSYGKYVDIDGVELNCELPLYDSICDCTMSFKEVRIYDEHLGYQWVDSLVQDCFYKADTVDFQSGVVVVNCADNVHCEQEVWADLDHCGQGYIHRKFKIWQRCADSTYADHPKADSIHPVDTIYRHQKIYVGNECDLKKAMFELPQDTAVETCAIEYDGAGNVMGIAGPENTGTPIYTFDDDCRLIGIAHEDKVYKIVGGDAACYKILRTWYFADWCGAQGPAVGKWWNDASLVVDKYVQKIIVTDTVAPICTINGPVEDGGSVQLSGCTYTLAVEVDAKDACGLTSYYWELSDISKADNQVIVDHGDGVFSGNEEESFGVVSEDLISGVYRLRVRIQDECNNESFCDYTIEVLPGKKPTPICITSLTARLTPWDSDGDGVIDSAHAIVWAEEYNQSSQLACADDSLEFRIEFIGDSPANEVPEAGSTSLEVTCANIGTQMVRMWVISHPSMTADFCDAFLMVQSDGNGCSTKQGTGERISQTESQNQVGNRKSRLGGNLGIDVTGDAGQFGGEGFALEQNTPNPFRHETSVKFSLPVSMEVTLTVFDLTGRELKNINATFNKGQNEVVLSKAELQSSGILYYRLTAGDFMEVRRMILIN